MNLNYMKSKVESYLGFARKSGKLAAGYNACIAAMEKRTLKLLLISPGLSENSRKKFQKRADSQKVPICWNDETEALSEAVGLRGIAVLGVLDPNLASAILNQLNHDGQNA